MAVPSSGSLEPRAYAYEDWMKHADEVLGDEQLVATVYEALAKRRPKSRNRDRPATPAEVVVRLLVLKQVHNWSYGVLEREARANLVYRNFTRVGAEKMPDAKTMGGWARALGPQTIKQIHERIVQFAMQRNELVPENWTGGKRDSRP
jgi:transposase, IS5 family